MLVSRRQSGDKASETQDPSYEAAPYDACICDLALWELPEIVRFYADLRPLIKDGGHVLFKTKKTESVFDGVELFLNLCDFPDVDVSEINFHGTAVSRLLEVLYLSVMRRVATRPIARILTIFALAPLAPIVWLANVWTALRDPSVFSSTWTSLTIEFTVKRRSIVAPAFRAERDEVAL
jgi:hypothetical protein